MTLKDFAVGKPAYCIYNRNAYITNRCCIEERIVRSIGRIYLKTCKTDSSPYETEFYLKDTNDTFLTQKTEYGYPAMLFLTKQDALDHINRKELEQWFHGINHNGISKFSLDQLAVMKQILNADAISGFSLEAFAAAKTLVFVHDRYYKGYELEQVKPINRVISNHDTLLIEYSEGHSDRKVIDARQANLNGDFLIGNENTDRPIRIFTSMRNAAKHLLGITKDIHEKACRYILIHNCEHDMRIVGVYKTHRDAYLQMSEELRQNIIDEIECDSHEEEKDVEQALNKLKAAVKNNEEFEYELFGQSFGITEDGAYSDINEKYLSDWRIFEIPIE